MEQKAEEEVALQQSSVSTIPQQPGKNESLNTTEGRVLVRRGSGTEAGENIGISSNSLNGRKRCHHMTKWISSHLAPAKLCPTLKWHTRLTTILILLLLFWGTMYTLFKDDVAPESNAFVLVALIILAYIVGKLISLIRLPPLLGMLLVGIVMRNVGLFNMEGAYKNVVSILRSMAMVVILIKAGLGLDAGALRRLSLVVIRLAFIPCLVEATVVLCVSHFLLDLPWLWGLLLGFVLGAVSPAVVVPSLLSLKDQGYGEDKGIATLVIAASSIDDIIAISGFGVVLGIIFSGGNLTQEILQGPLEVLIGLSFGIFWGLISIYIPHKDETFVVPARAVMVGFGGLFAVFGSPLAGFSGAGPLASIVAAFVACFGWKKQGWSASYNPVENVFSCIWQIFQPILFGLIGTEIDVSAIDGETIAYAIAVLSIGLTIRILVTFLVVFGSTLNLKEKLFVAIAWFPKATVQAALGPVALDLAIKNNASEIARERASQILTVAVLSILITAPLGAIGIYFSGPHLLTKVDVKVRDQPKKRGSRDMVTNP